MNKHSGHRIKNVKQGSIAEELEIEAGDILLKINGEEMEDVFDYQYLMEDSYVEILIQKPSGEEWVLEIDKDYDEDLGVEFEQGLMDDYRSCYNKCIFCFIDQMPKGMRETLYFKDDDSRLSFLQGNYITLTNMSDKDVERIIRYHLCPINISIQTTNPELRCKMLNNRFAGEALKKIDRLAQACIEMNGQIVLCKGVNDKDELKRSIEDLSKYLPHMRSVSVVPAGLTKYREGLYPLELFTKEEAAWTIDLIESYQQRFYEKYGLHFIHASDEWYILAGREFPEEERYDGYIQLENGVGMMRLLFNEFQEALEDTPGSEMERTVSLATGALAYDMMCRLAELLQCKFPNIHVHIYKIRNDFFGETITVSGLLTGGDIIRQLKGKELGECLLLPCNVLRSGEDVFLDDVTLDEMKTALQVEVNIVKSGGKDLLLAFTKQPDLPEEDIRKEEQETAGFVYKECYPDRSWR
jgi:putative radical SAM enzyme (TIGR03279 family)